jgi:S1-C subfamily serine protease
VPSAVELLHPHREIVIGRGFDVHPRLVAPTVESLPFEARAHPARRRLQDGDACRHEVVHLETVEDLLQPCDQRLLEISCIDGEFLGALRPDLGRIGEERDHPQGGLLEKPLQGRRPGPQSDVCRVFHDLVARGPFRSLAFHSGKRCYHERMDPLEAYSAAVTRAVETAGPSVVRIDVAHARVRVRGEGLGSGVIVRSNGIIVTNEHVVHGATRIRVSLADGRNMTGTILGKDNRHDLAVLQVEGGGLPMAEFGDSRALKVGQLVVALGNPLGLKLTATAGVVSALDRSLQLGRTRVLEQMIQTDASINPGNSGGPLVDVHGRVVGINTAIIAGAQGLGFAVSSHVVEEAVVDVVDRGIREGVWIGLAGEPVQIDPLMASRLRVRQKLGLMILNVAPNSPAERAGIRILDVLCTVGRRRVASMEQLRNALRGHRPGDLVRVTLLRWDSLRGIPVVLASYPG